MEVHEMLHAIQSFFYLLVSGRIGATHIAFSTCPEGVSGYDSDAFFIEQFLGEGFIVHAGDAYIWEGVKSTMGFESGQSKLVQTATTEFTPAIIFIAHLDDKLLTMLNGFQCSHLRHRGSRHDGVLVDADEPLDNVFWAAGDTRPPAG